MKRVRKSLCQRRERPSEDDWIHLFKKLAVIYSVQYIVGEKDIKAQLPYAVP